MKKSEISQANIRFGRTNWFMSIALVLGLAANAFAQDLPVEEALLTTAPNVPPPIERDYAAKVVVNLETLEFIGRLSDGVEYTFWTFGGSVPGSFIRVREGDLVEFHLNNHPSSKMPHNIDLHAVTGPGGGASSSFTAPGKSSVFSFTARTAGLFVYHCATAPVGMHIANGMYGLILVEPEGGLSPVDKEYYVMQSEFYTKGAYGDEGLQPFSMEKALTEIPDYVVFNGSVGSMVGDNAITATVGDTVRLFVGNGGPNLISSFHVIGEIFDAVYVEGGTTINKNVQTTIVPAGGSTIVEFTLETSGTYILVDHSIFRAFNKGAIGMLKVDGPENKIVYSGKQEEGIYLPEGSSIQILPGGGSGADATGPLSREKRMAMGERIYTQNCLACHQMTGAGIPGAFPPLAGSDFLAVDKARSIGGVLNGFQGEMVVNGQTYNGVMPGVLLNDQKVASVLTYVMNSWNNNFGEVTTAEVTQKRSEH